MSTAELLLNVVSDLLRLADSLSAMVDGIDQKEIVPKTEHKEKETTPSAPAVPTVTIEQVRAAMATKSSVGKTTEVRELLIKFGGSKLSEIDPARYPELLAAAEEL